MVNVCLSAILKFFEMWNPNQFQFYGLSVAQHATRERLKFRFTRGFQIPCDTYSLPGAHREEFVLLHSYVGMVGVWVWGSGGINQTH